MSFVEFHDVKKIYHMGEVEIPALQGVNFEIEKGEFCVIVLFIFIMGYYQKFK